MTYPLVQIVDAETGENIVREMTDDEYTTLVASGWTPSDEPTPEPTAEEETPEE